MDLPGIAPAYNRIVSGAFSGPEMRATIRAVRAIGFPRDDLVQLEVCDYLDRFSQQGKYGLYVRDTNSLFKGRSADYKRPGQIFLGTATFR